MKQTVSELQKLKKLEEVLNNLIYTSLYNNKNILYEILKASNEVFSSNRSSIWVQEKENLKCLSIYPYYKRLQNIKIPFPDPAQCQKKLQAHKPFILDLKADSHLLCQAFKQYIDKKNTRTILITPIILNSQIIGVIANSSIKDSDEWSNDELSFAMVVSTIVSLHIQTQKTEQITKKLQDVKTFLDNSDTIIFHWSADEGWPVISVTKNISLFGYSDTDFLSKKIDYASIIYKEDIETISKEVTYNLEHNIDNFTQIYRITTSSGDVRWVDDKTTVQRDENNNVIGLLGIIHDITEKKEIEQTLKENEEQFRAMVESSLAGVFVYRDTFLYANKAFKNITGYSSSELATMIPETILDKKLQTQFHKFREKRIRGELLTSSDYQNISLIRKDGQKRIVRISASTIQYEGKYAGAGTIIDVTDIIQEKKLRLQLSQALKQTDDIVYVTDVHGTITYVNESTIKNYGYSEKELLGNNARIFASHKHDLSFYKKLWEIILSGDNYHYMFINRTKDGKLLYEEKNITPIFNENNKIESFVSTGTNITQRMELEKKLQEMAIIDNLTQIYNRHKLNEVISKELERVQRYKENSVLVMLDIDHFKAINDTYGHNVGDEVLKFLSKTILQSIRKVDIFGRWGGEEFILIFSHMDISHALLKAESIRKMIEDSFIDEKYNITISLGVTKFMQEDTITQLLKRVDDALYEAKESGRNRVVVKE